MPFISSRMFILSRHHKNLRTGRLCGSCCCFGHLAVLVAIEAIIDSSGRISCTCASVNLQKIAIEALWSKRLSDKLHRGDTRSGGLTALSMVGSLSAGKKILSPGQVADFRGCVARQKQRFVQNNFAGIWGRCSQGRMMTHTASIREFLG